MRNLFFLFAALCMPILGFTQNSKIDGIISEFTPFLLESITYIDYVILRERDSGDQIYHIYNVTPDDLFLVNMMEVRRSDTYIIEYQVTANNQTYKGFARRMQIREFKKPQRKLNRPLRFERIYRA